MVGGIEKGRAFKSNTRFSFAALTSCCSISHWKKWEKKEEEGEKKKKKKNEKEKRKRNRLN